MIESSIQPLTPVQKTPASLSEFSTGQRITAQIQSPLPEGTFQAIVAGRSMTLALPHSAKSGDVLELVVTGQRDQVITARTLLPEEKGGGEAPQASLSQTGRLISQLLTGRYGEASALALSKGEALQEKTINPNPEKLASSLKQAVSQSGLFYEAHLKNWAEGKTPLVALRGEPQATYAQPGSSITQNTPESASLFLPQRLVEEAGFFEDLNTTLDEAPNEEEGKALPRGKDLSAEQANANSLKQGPEEGRKSNDGPASSAGFQALFRGMNTPSGGLQAIPEAMMPMIYQQLETLATNQMQWQFQPWSGTNVEWDLVSPDNQSASGAEAEEAPLWRSQLRMHFPEFGDIDALLVFGPSGLNIRLDTGNDVAAKLLRASSQRLLETLDAAGVPVNGFTVSKHEDA